MRPLSHHVVIVGAGFGGLEAAHCLAGADVRITVIDRRNHHLFQPLLYQVATASLAPSEIAWPIRHLLRKRKDITTLLAAVSGIDKSKRTVLLEGGDKISYDTLVLATGGSIVTHPENYAFLQEHARTVWLRADAKDHWNRVIEQGDKRPMAENPQAFSELKALLSARTPLYASADHIIDTTGRKPGEIVAELVKLLH